MYFYNDVPFKTINGSAEVPPYNLKSVQLFPPSWPCFEGPATSAVVSDWSFAGKSELVTRACSPKQNYMFVLKKKIRKYNKRRVGIPRMSGRAFRRPVLPDVRNSWLCALLESGVVGGAPELLLVLATWCASITASIFKTENNVLKILKKCKTLTVE